MSYKILVTKRFQKEAKRLVKKFASLKNELQTLNNDLLENPLQGTPLGNNSFKIRLAIKSKGKGSSGGARVITHVAVSGENVYLLTIYDKSEKESISDKELRTILKNIGL